MVLLRAGPGRDGPFPIRQADDGLGIIRGLQRPRFLFFLDGASIPHRRFCPRLDRERWVSPPYPPICRGRFRHRRRLLSGLLSLRRGDHLRLLRSVGFGHPHRLDGAIRPRRLLHLQYLHRFGLMHLIDLLPQLSAHPFLPREGVICL